MQKEYLKHKFIITGSTGWIGKCLLDKLYSVFGDDLNNNVVALSNSSSQFTLQNGYKVYLKGYDHDFEDCDNYILCHFAFLTMDKVKNMTNEQYISQNGEIQDKISKIIRRTRPKSIIYSSSGAVYKKDNLYGQMKIDDENYFQEIAKEVGCSMVIPRIFNIGGPYINKHNLYAISDFIVQLIKGGEVVINAPHRVIRSYVHINDILDICLSWALDRDNQGKSIIFDTKNKKDVDLLELANQIIKVTNIRGSVTISENYPLEGKEDKYTGSSDLINEVCKQYSISLKGYEEIIKDTYKYLKN